MKKVTLFFALAVALSMISRAGIIEKTYLIDDPTISRTENYASISFDGCLLTGLPGEPTLPYLTVKLLLPPGQEASSIEFAGHDEVILAGAFLLYPKQYVQPISRGRSGIFVINEQVYAQESPYPSAHTGQLTTEYMNGYAIAMATFTPLTYHPSTGTVSYFRSVTIRITTTESPSARQALDMLNARQAVIGNVEDFVQNSEALHHYPVTVSRDESYDYLIITDDQFTASFDELRAHYLQSGLESEVITTGYIESAFPGQDLQEKIRNCIIQEYQDHAIEYVLLAGDVEFIPYRGFYCTVQSSSVYESDDIPSDLYYSGLDGTWNDNGNNRWGEIGEDDLLPEVAVTRLPFGNQNELGKMLHKVLSYQDSPVLNELRNPLLAGEWLYGNPETWGSDYLELLIGHHEDNGYTTDGIPEDHTIEKLYEEIAPWSGSTLIASINQGKSFVHHVGHASTTYTMYLSNSDITNANFSEVDGTTHNYTLVYTHGCDCGGFDYNDCILEEMVKIDNFAAAVVGNSRYGWFNEGQTEGPSQHLHREFVDAIYHDKLNRIGRAHMESRTQTAPWVNAPGQWEEGAQRWCFYDCNVLGESAMPIWTDNPVTPDVDYVTAVAIGQLSMDVTVTFQGYPMEGIRCAIVKDAVLFGLGITDATGMAVINFDQVFTEPGEAQLVVSGYNCLTATYPITIIPSQGAYVICTAHSIGDPTGNGNGIPEFGETIQLTLDITNVGEQTAADVTVTLSSSDPYVTITDGEENYGSIAGGATLSVENGFAFEIAPDIPDQHVVAFQVSAAAEDTWTSDFSVTCNAPNLFLGAVSVDDQTSGNGNGILDPGETASLLIVTSNRGHCPSTDVNGSITTNDPYLTIDNGIFQTALLNVEESIQAVYQVSLSDGAPLGSVVSFRCELSSGEYYITKEYQLATGIITEDFESGDFLNHNWQFGGSAPWEICETNPYEGSYCSKSGTISDGSTSEMIITADVLADDSIAFFYKVSSEPSYDFLQFYIDNVKKGEWSGEIGWSYVAYPVNAGEHSFRWVYSKDWYVGAGQDCAWLDYIVFPPIYNPVAIEEHNAPAILHIYPNPLDDLLTVDYQVTVPSHIGISIFNASGQKILQVTGLSVKAPGTYTEFLDLASLNPGVYYLRMDTSTGAVIRKIIKL